MKVKNFHNMNFIGNLFTHMEYLKETKKTFNKFF